MNRRGFLRHIALLLPALILWPIWPKNGMDVHWLVIDELHMRSNHLWHKLHWLKLTEMQEDMRIAWIQAAKNQILNSKRLKINALMPKGKTISISMKIPRKPKFDICKT